MTGANPDFENPYAAPQTRLQDMQPHGGPWLAPRSRTNYFAAAFRIAVVLSIMSILWIGVNLLLIWRELGWQELYLLAFLAIIVCFFLSLLVMMVLCSFVVGIDLILQYLRLRTPPPPHSSAILRVEPDELFFHELAKQHMGTSFAREPR